MSSNRSKFFANKRDSHPKVNMLGKVRVIRSPIQPFFVSDLLFLKTARFNIAVYLFVNRSYDVKK